MATPPPVKPIPAWTIDAWTLSVSLLGTDALTEPQAVQIRRHLTEKFAGHAKPSPASAKGADDTGLTGKGFVLVSKLTEMPKVFLGIGLKDGTYLLSWEPLGEDSPNPPKSDTPRPQNFHSTMPHMTGAELTALGEMAA